MLPRKHKINVILKCRLRYEAQKNPHFFKKNGGARSIYFSFQNTLHCAALNLKINRLRLSKDMTGYYILKLCLMTLRYKLGILSKI